MRVRNGKLCFNPFIPESWNSYSFRINFRHAHLEFKMDKSHFQVVNHSKVALGIFVNDKPYDLSAKDELTIEN